MRQKSEYTELELFNWGGNNYGKFPILFSYWEHNTGTSTISPAISLNIHPNEIMNNRKQIVHPDPNYSFEAVMEYTDPIETAELLGHLNSFDLDAQIVCYRHEHTGYFVYKGQSK